LRQFLEHCAHGVNAATGGTGAPLDFISYHPKGSPHFVDGHVPGVPGDRSSSSGWVEMSIKTQLSAADEGMRVVSSFPEWRRTPIILGEFDPEGCAACQGSQNGYRNGPLYGVSVAEGMMRTYELARTYGLTVEGVVTWAFEFEDQTAFAGFRELATNGIDKPVLDVFRMFGMLGARRSGGEWIETESSGAIPLDHILSDGVRAAPDVNAVATRNGSEVDVLVWNYHDDDVTAPAAKIHLTVDGLHGTTVTEAEFQMDANHSNAYAVWQKMGSPPHPDAEQTVKLEQAGQLDEIQDDRAVTASEGAATIEIELPRQGVALVRIRGK
jgi:xylan 1,4-beta-xylosidase